jgi:hypothetical protein
LLGALAAGVDPDAAKSGGLGSKANSLFIMESLSPFSLHVLSFETARIQTAWGSQPICASVRLQVKQNIVNIMCGVSPDVQRQLSEALTIISEHDFPGDDWLASSL